MSEAGTFERVAALIGDALLPLARALADPGELLVEFGVAINDDALAGLASAAAGTARAVEDLGNFVTALNVAIKVDDSIGITSNGAAVAQRIDAVLNGLASVQTGVTAALNSPSVTPAQRVRAQALLNDLPGRIVTRLIVDRLRVRLPKFTMLLAASGLLEGLDVPGDAADPMFPPHFSWTIRWDRIGRFLGQPLSLLRDAYGLGTPGFDGKVLLQLLAQLLDTGDGRLDRSYIATGAGGVGAVLFGPGLIVGVRDGGLAFPTRLGITGKATQKFPLGERTVFSVGVDGTVTAGSEVRLSPALGVTIVPPQGAPSAALNATAAFTVGKAGEPITVLGDTRLGGLTFETASLALSLNAKASADGTATAEPSAQVEVTGGHLVIDLSGADGFIGKLVGARFETGFDLRLLWTPSAGVRLEGSETLELALPLHLKLGPLEITTLHLSVGLPADGSLPIEVSTDFKGALGPIQASVERIGIVAKPRFPAGGGNLGPVDFALGFKPPKGVGLEIDTGIVVGGGYLSFDPDRGEYSGALELEFAGFIDVKAIGLISTRMPDGRPGFSLLIVLTAEFGGGGIQLGFGFTLLAVGGILGLNRRMDLAALVEGVASGAIESVMFPRDVVANAPRIISDLRRFFPPEDGRFLVGPMAKIGWGTPALVSVSLGVIIEIPPGNIAILGVLKCVLPSEDVPLLKLQVNFIGAFEVDKSRLWFYAQLVDSRVLTITIDGGMGLLINMGDDPDFVLSVGGFHPSFKPPPLPFPIPPRVSLDILNAPGRLIRVSGYFAVTSNTAQFGAKAELRLGFDDFGIEGHLAFDALFRFSPFAFVIEISAGVSLKAFGVGLFSIDLRFQLEGPSPWRAHGRGSISLLFFEISADFDISWGEERTTTLPPVAVLELLEREVRKPEGWQTRLPAGGTNPLVTLRRLPEGDELVLHPLGTLFIHQRAVPLDVRIDRVGAQRPSDGKRFSVAPVAGSGLERASVTDDQFAMAQFQDMDDAAKLSRPAYEKQDAGIELTAEKGAIASPRVVRRSARYEMHIIDSRPPRPAAARMAAADAPAARRTPKLYSPPPAVFGQLLEGSSTARSPLSQREARLRQPFPADETVRVTGDRFVVAYRRNNRQAFPPAATGSTTSSFRSAATAADAMADWIRADPTLAGQVHVLPQAEVGGGAAAQPGTWSVAGPPPSAVAGADAVRLTGGKVLVAGGADATGKAVATAALYDPVAAAWADATPPLATARRRHTTTKLADGRVVVAGGLGADGAPLASAEMFEPVAAAWSTPQGLHTARHGHSATATGDGLLVAGGTGARGAALASAELYDPDTATWAEVAPMGCARTGHQAVPIGGRVLVIGGALPTGEGERALAFCEIYDPAAKTWTPTGSLLTPRKGHQATVLSDGRVLVTGGDAVPSVPYRVDGLASAELYDPATGAWTRVADLPGGGRSGHRSVLTPAGVVVIGGTGRARATAGYRDAVVFDPGSGAWTATGRLGTGRWDFPAVDLADGRVLVAGGLALAGAAAPGPDPAELAATAEIYLP
ncbi:DUF6603 domain-containing protein [Actinomadura decatromicini]|uniref:DUF6603 domain-containing protein n=1 Tax=Actinomadura decatromicini TaxID=2604572 RepID=A0A5D3FU49_9ACTN|nr:DUF6603 domain-containing protein [Actinomadura decatromicini]TYK51396.1 hypothetical protein FXF68_13410 [Actinomadura decatromicini]